MSDVPFFFLSFFFPFSFYFISVFRDDINILWEKSHYMLFCSSVMKNYIKTWRVVAFINKHISQGSNGLTDGDANKELHIKHIYMHIILPGERVSKSSTSHLPHWQSSSLVTALNRINNKFGMHSYVKAQQSLTYLIPLTDH